MTAPQRDTSSLVKGRGRGRVRVWARLRSGARMRARMRARVRARVRARGLGRHRVSEAQCAAMTAREPSETARH